MSGQLQFSGGEGMASSPVRDMAFCNHVRKQLAGWVVSVHAADNTGGRIVGQKFLYRTHQLADVGRAFRLLPMTMRRSCWQQNGDTHDMKLLPRRHGGFDLAATCKMLCLFVSAHNGRIANLIAVLHTDVLEGVTRVHT